MTKSNNPHSLTGVEAIQKRPMMYIGTSGFFGLIHYLVCPFAQLLSRSPRWIDVRVAEAGFEINSDATLDIKENGEGRIIPFEAFEAADKGLLFEGCLLNALSERLEVRAAHSGSLHSLTYERGRRTSHAIAEEA